MSVRFPVSVRASMQRIATILAFAYAAEAPAQGDALNASALVVTRDEAGGVLIFDRDGERAERDAEKRIEAFCDGRSFRILSRQYVAFGSVTNPSTKALQPVIRYRMAYACAHSERDVPPIQ